MNHLIEVLGEQISCAQAMLAALARESEALLGNAPDELSAASSAKASLVDTLESLETRRRALSAAVGEQARATTEWLRLQQLIAECKQRNDKNGALLKARAAHVRATLEGLRGTQPAVYGRRGAAPVRAEARPLGTA